MKGKGEEIKWRARAVGCKSSSGGREREGEVKRQRERQGGSGVGESLCWQTVLSPST